MGAGVLLTSLPCIHPAAGLSLSPSSPLCSNVPGPPFSKALWVHRRQNEVPGRQACMCGRKVDGPWW